MDDRTLRFTIISYRLNAIYTTQLMSTCVEALSYTLCWHPGKKRKSGRTRLQFIAAFHGPEYNNRLCWKQNVMSQRHETATIRRHSFKTKFVIVWRLLCTVYMWWRDDRTNVVLRFLRAEQRRNPCSLMCCSITPRVVTCNLRGTSLCSRLSIAEHTSAETGACRRHEK